VNKTLIRSYAIGESGDISVVSYKAGDRINMSTQYADEQHPKRGDLRPDACVEVYRFDDGKLGWMCSPNGHDPMAAVSLALLLRLFTDDIERADDDPRAF